MSLFDFSSSTARPSDGAMNMRVSEISPDGNNLSGQMQFRWSSSASQWWTPASTWLEVRFKITGTTNNPLISGDGVKTVFAPGDCAFSSVNHTINGVQVGSCTDPAVAGMMLKKAFMTNERRRTLGGLQILNFDQIDFTGDELVCHFVPPLGLYMTGASICGGQHVLTTQLHNAADLVTRLFAVNRANVAAVQLTSAKLFVTHVSPVDPVRPPPTAVINTLDLHTSSQAMSVNGSVTLTYSVPPSTRKIFIGSTKISIAPGDPFGVNFFTPLIAQGPLVEYAGQQLPVREYTAADTRRKYYDLHAAKLMSSSNPFEAHGEYSSNPLTLHAFAKAPDSADMSAQVRLTANAAATPSLIHVGALHSNAVVLQYGSDGLIQNVAYSVVL